jgi:hypothetical protein
MGDYTDSNKFEARSTKFETNTKSKGSKSQTKANRHPSLFLFSFVFLRSSSLPFFSHLLTLLPSYLLDFF